MSCMNCESCVHSRNRGFWNDCLVEKKLEALKKEELACRLENGFTCADTVDKEIIEEEIDEDFDYECPLYEYAMTEEDYMLQAADDAAKCERESMY